jgi:DNA-binding Lrp family transcriptional regulator
MNVTDLMTDSLKEHPEQRNFFKPIPAPEWPDFVDGIDLNGIIVPLFVSARDGVMVLDGHQRLTAARQLGLETVPVILREFETEADEVAFMVTVNDGRRHDSAETRANRADYFLRKYVGQNKSDRDVAAKAGVSHPYVIKRRKKLEAEGGIPKREYVVGRDGKKQKAEKSGGNKLPPEQPVKTKPAPALTPEKFICPECSGVFTEEVWHCPVCVHHWPLDDDECKSCHQVTRLASGELQVSAFTNEDDEDGVTPVTPEPVSLVSPKEIPNVMAFKLHKGVDAVLAVSDDDMRAFLQTGVTEHDRMIHKLTTLAAKLDRVLVAPPKAEPVLGEGKAWN